MALRGSDEIRAMCAAMLFSASVASVGGIPSLFANEAAATRVDGFVRFHFFHAIVCLCLCVYVSTAPAVSIQQVFVKVGCYY